jgi:hypothetical protein
MFMFKAAFLFFAVAHCRNLQVYVGRNNSLLFEPNTLRAFPGDTVEFIFAGLVSGSDHSILSFISNWYCRTTRLRPAILSLAANLMDLSTLASFPSLPLLLLLLPLHPLLPL